MGRVRAEMKKTISIFTLILFGMGMCFALWAEVIPSEKPPHINISEEQWDTGTVTQGEVVTRTFVIKNTGGAELILDRVRPSCGCIATFTFNPKIPPGGSTELKINYDSKSDRGDIAKSIFIDSNDPDSPHKIINITGTVRVLPKVSISFEPQSWNFDFSSSKEPSAFQFAIENNGNSPLRISSIGVSSNTMDASISSSDIAPHRSATVTVNSKPQAKESESGKKEEYISVTIDIPIRQSEQ